MIGKDNVIDADIGPILQLGVELCMEIRVAGKEAMGDLTAEFDAILIAAGSTAKEQAEQWGLKTGPRGIHASKQTYRTNIDGTFAAGGAIRGKAMVVRSVADGKEAAVGIDQYLAGLPVTGPSKPFNTRIGKLEPDELAQAVAVGSPSERQDPAAGPLEGFTAEEAVEQARRCLHCDCRAIVSCKLRKYAGLYHADPKHYAAQRRPLRLDLRHDVVIFEPGKCIDCGVCIEIAAAAGEPLGLTFIGRGFDVRVGVPLDGSLRDALKKVAAECAAACPTAAIALRDERSG